MTYDPDRNGADSYALAIAEIRKRGWACPALPGARCRKPGCFTANICEHNKQPLGGRHVGS